MAEALAELMSRLGYEKYGVQGGDFGAFLQFQEQRELVAAFHAASRNGDFAALLFGQKDDRVPCIQVPHDPAARAHHPAPGRWGAPLAKRSRHQSRM